MVTVTRKPKSLTRQSSVRDASSVEKALPAEVFLYYANKLNLSVRQNDENQIGVPLPFYLPKLRNAVEISADVSFSEERLRPENVKNDLCRKSGITMTRIVKKTIQSLHTCICIRLSSFDLDSLRTSLAEAFNLNEKSAENSDAYLVQINLTEKLSELRKQWEDIRL